MTKMTKSEVKTKLLNLFIPIVIFIISFVFSIFIVRTNTSINSLIILSDDFILKYIGSFFAFFIATISFLYSSSGKLHESLLVNNIEENIRDKIKNNIRELIIEIKSDIMIILYLLFINFFVIIIRNCDIPYIQWPAYLSFSKSEVISCIKLTTIFLTLFAIYDVTYSLFRIIFAHDHLSNKQ